MSVVDFAPATVLSSCDITFYANLPSCARSCFNSADDDTATLALLCADLIPSPETGAIDHPALDACIRSTCDAETAHAVTVPLTQFSSDCCVASSAGSRVRLQLNARQLGEPEPTTAAAPETAVTGTFGPPATGTSTGAPAHTSADFVSTATAIETSAMATEPTPSNEADDNGDVNPAGYTSNVVYGPDSLGTGTVDGWLKQVLTADYPDYQVSRAVKGVGSRMLMMLAAFVGFTMFL
ncbi:hypothetical protein HK101_011513 [Irineochytrium annulatum]|nr:hypothetical protein HK101_011513 [Irineochytrium annulatum]